MHSEMENGPFGFSGPVRQTKLSDQIYDRIFGLIVSGEFPAKSKLPTEVELSDRFDVSRTIVREALARLRDDGVVVSRQGAGTFVQRQPNQAILGFQPLGSLADVQRCFEFRVGLEGEAAFFAAARRDQQKIGEIARAFEELESIIRQGSVGSVADYDFHLAVARATCNPFFVSVMESLKGHIDFGMNLLRSLSLKKSFPRVQKVQGEHAKIYEAIRDGTPEIARDAMRQHIENARRRMFDGESE
jgi:DNA-binding FadR family transcriptional regulator